MYDIPEHKIYALGDVVSFIAPTYPVLEVQGRIMYMFSEDPEQTNNFMTVTMIVRCPKDARQDIITDKYKIYDMVETNEDVVINFNSVTKLVPSLVIDSKQGLLVKLKEHFKPKELREGVFYISEYEDALGQFHPATDPQVTLACFHFDPEVSPLLNTIDAACWKYLKTLVFNKFIAASTRSSRRSDDLKNMNLWELLVNNFSSSPEEIIRLCAEHPIAISHPRRLEIPSFCLLDIEKLIGVRFSIPFILESISQFRKLWLDNPISPGPPEVLTWLHKRASQANAVVEMISEQMDKPTYEDDEADYIDDVVGKKRPLESECEDIVKKQLKEFTVDEEESDQETVVEEKITTTDDEEETEDSEEDSDKLCESDTETEEED